MDIRGILAGVLLLVGMHLYIVFMVANFKDEPMQIARLRMRTHLRWGLAGGAFAILLRRMGIV